MERDPLAFVWRTAPALHLYAFVLLALAFPLAWVALDLLRVALDLGVAGTAFEHSPYAAFLRLQIDLPERIADQPLVLFRGVSLERMPFILATATALAALALAGALLTLALRRIEAAIEARVTGRLRRDMLGGILHARPAAREEARQAAALASEGLGQAAGRLGAAAITPVMAGGGIALALLYTLRVDWRIALALAVLLAAAAFVWPVRIKAEEEAAAARRGEGASLRRALEDLVRRLPAVRAHGTGPHERGRLEQELRSRAGPVRAGGRRLARAASASFLVAVLIPALVVGLGAWLGLTARATPGEVAAAGVAGIVGAVALAGVMRWRQDLAAARPLFEEVARMLGSFQARGRHGGTAALPGSGALAARKASAYDPASGARVTGLDLSLALPAHVAVVGDAASGAGAFAALVAGQLEPLSGELTYGGVDLRTADPAERARRLAFAGGDTVLVSGSLRQNLLYGGPGPDAPEIEHRLIDAATAVGLDRLIHARGLSGTVNPAREPKLAAAIVDARRAVRGALAAEGLGDLVEPFDPKRYNRQATVGENILFGMPLGDTFREANLPSHPFVRGILEAEGLTKPLTAMGLSIAASLVEIFADIPDGHPLFDRFSFFSSAERAYFADLVERQGERRRGAESARDRERLMGLTLRYSESRHRLGLVDADVEARLVAARAAFANSLPLSLKPALEFYDPDALCAAASLQDNLLFGRVNHDRAGAEALVRRLVRRVLTDRGLDQDVMRIGLDSPVDVRGSDFTAAEVAAIDVARCLVRGPDTLIVEHAFADLAPGVADEAVVRLRRALVGRGLIVVLRELSGHMDTPPFDVVVRLDRGVATVDSRRRSVSAGSADPAVPEPVA
ncbi:MAG TPA: ABC transporter ATP-binding protein [Beijerinckiaceae bacterium]|jgi:ABC-type multidrug transport system fused ATPase/permease subunit